MSGGVLSLPNDQPHSAPSIAEHLAIWAAAMPERLALAQVITTIAAAAVPLGARLALGSLPGDPGAIFGTNDSGDKQKALDVAAHDHVIAALRTASVRQVLSEEAEALVDLQPEGRFNVAIDPIDGSGSIGIGAPLGLLFCIFPAEGGFLRSGREIIAAGYVSFGHSTDMAFSVGEGVAVATLDARRGTFHIEETAATTPVDTATIAFNASNLRHWGAGLQAYIAATMAGKDGPRGRDFNMRWLAAAVGELHRILRRGGLFLYPSDRRKGYENGRLRLIYEAFPIAWIIEQAGGSASDGKGAILDRIPTTLHQHTPLIFGARNEVAALHRFLTETPNEGEM